jgi:Na+-transporting NADH:ubiquinone oxidoreductase subunit C
MQARAQAKDTPLRALLTVLVTAVICSTVVSASVVLLRPIQLNNQLLERSGNIMQLTGLLPAGEAVEDDVLLELFKSLDTRVVNIDEADFDDGIDPYTFDARKAAGDPELSVAVPAAQDRAKLGRRSRFKVVYLVWQDGVLDRVILPIRGAGMWSMLYGYVALEPDFNTLAGVIFYEQNETPGLGDQISQDYWERQWQGKQLYDETGEMLFHVAEGPVTPGSAAADYQVDALTGATVTANAVTALMQYWFGPDGYGPLLQRLREQPPQRPTAAARQET